MIAEGARNAPTVNSTCVFREEDWEICLPRVGLMQQQNDEVIEVPKRVSDTLYGLGDIVGPKPFLICVRELAVDHRRVILTAPPRPRFVRFPRIGWVVTYALREVIVYPRCVRGNLPPQAFNGRRHDDGEDDVRDLHSL